MSLSKRQWGYIFLGVGVFFFLTGVICGVLIPKIIVSVVESKSCVDSVDDSDYEDWVKEKSNVVSQLYYWVIENKDGFLYNGEMPKLKERGPYVYKIKSQNIEASFQDNRRTYKNWKKNATFSKEDSCSNCSEEDDITVINMGYLATMERYGGDVNFAMFYLPFTIAILLKKFNHTQLGNINKSTTWPDNGLSGWSNPGFGAYAKMKNFSEIEMKGLYGALGNDSILFGDTLRNTTAKKTCAKNNHIYPNCGLLAHMNVFSRNQTNMTVLSFLIHLAFCTNPNQSCFNISALRKVFPYILHVSSYTMWHMLYKQDDIVTTISQKKIALGYAMIKTANPVTSKLINIPGLVRVYASKEYAINDTKNESFYTCDASEEKKYQWAAFDGSETIPSSSFNLSGEDAIIRGYSHVVPHSKTATKPCSFSQTLPLKSFDIFLSPMQTKLKVTLKEDTSLYGLQLKRFTIKKTDFLQHSAVKNGLIDLSKIRKFPVVVSLPHFLYADNLNIPASFNQKAVEEKHQSIYDVEPVTGIVARAQLRFQINVPIKTQSVSVRRIKPFNIGYKTNTTDELLVKGIPFVWMKLGGEAKESDVGVIKKNVIGLLGLSCGLLIALPIIGGIFIVVFIALLALSVKANQITEIS